MHTKSLSALLRVERLMYQNILVMLNMEISTPHTHDKMPQTH